jgi:hypothetical protein
LETPEETAAIQDSQVLAAFYIQTVVTVLPAAAARVAAREEERMVQPAAADPLL